MLRKQTPCIESRYAEMSFQVIDFESSREKDKKRQLEREARTIILEKAKNEYEAKKAREELARQRGENTWMLSSVEAKLESSKKKKKKEKKKKKKKEKKSKKKKKDDSSSSSSESEDDEKWIEKSGSKITAQTPELAARSGASREQDLPSGQTKREGWMEMTSLFGTYTRDEMRERDGTSRKKAKEEEEARKREANKPGSHARELNPYFKDGGTGLPEEKPQQSTSVGMDASWLRRALQRAKEQAEKENKTLEEIAAQRWGSLAKFHELLAEAEGRNKRQSENQPMGGYRDRSPGRERRGFQGYGRGTNREKYGERKRSSSRDRQGYRGRRSSSRERQKDRRKSRSRSRDRKRRSKSRERQRRSKSRERQRRSRSKEHSTSKEKRRHRRYSSSYSSSSGSDSNSSKSRSRSRSRSKDSRNKGDYKEQNEGGMRNMKGLFKPPSDDTEHNSKPSILASRFQKPGEGKSVSSFHERGRPGNSRGWQKRQPQEREPSQEGTKRRSVSSSSSSSSSSDSEEEPTPVKVEKVENEAFMPAAAVEGPAPMVKMLTDKEMNELAAKIMKAELIGNEAQATKLKKKLEAARTARANAPVSMEEGGENESKEETVVLTRMDARGVCRPISGKAEGAGEKKRKKMQTHDKGGQRTKYFPDDDQYDLKRMFEREKGTSAADQNSLFERSAMHNVEKLNEEYDLDDMFMSKAVQKETAAKQAERDRQRAIEEHHRSQKSLEACQWCFDNKEMPKHLIVALGTKAYVCLPPHQSLTPGHCLIIPIHHVPCAVQADEDLWSEIQNFRKSLVRMFNSRDEDCIFFETVKRLRNYPHMVINCVPLPREIGDMAPIYFKKAIMECEAEWAQNKKLVDLKNRDVRSAVPKGLPYFFVDFAMDPGYAHVIEDEQDFPYTFAQEIVGGMMDLENNLWRKPRRENFDAQRKKVMEFSNWYKEFDITQE